MARGPVSAAAVVPLLMFLLILTRCSAAWWEEGEGEWRPEEEEGGKQKQGRMFVLERLEKVVDSEGGKVHVVRGQPWPPGSFREGLMHIGFIDMEPKTLFVPQYLDSALTLFVQRGEVKVAWIYKDELVEKKLKMGDVVHIDAGSTFYMVNTGKGQRLHIICSIDASDGLGFGPPYQSFFLGGAGRPMSVLAGFEPKTLAVAFNTTYDELASVLLAQTRGPIVYYAAEPGGGGGEEEDEHEHSRDAHNARCREAHAWRQVGRGEDDDGCSANNDDVPAAAWSWRKLLNRFIGGDGADAATSENKKEKKKKKGSAPEPYNLYDNEPGFRNTYGWTVAVDRHDYEPLKHSDIGVYLVNLTAGSMLAPHVNPRATEYGVVLGGEGVIQVVFPNGSLAMSAVVRAGDVFWIPRYFPFCQVASRGGPFEFFGFTTSARRNHPQFLVGATSLLRTMLGPELAAGIGAREEELRDIVQAQEESVILPSFPGTRKKKRHGKEEESGRKWRREREPPVIEQVAKE
ncbi:hypothetical protein PR202_gb19791 [Eleusine coracana subsp. coracana]|uniref:Cupin type-1 domain-containing protein n=1 Tax=Eleusine coracana subsp. coracana TaxID=191504 RepID=A0AAV5FAX9_ELECO|nr:hypothetical protein QOZ80_3BG0280860 [Eleusine coracana subsp. coracana]GJN31396.1 hypothetical protein PR202_gb19791 [Eleusine coracana subsp. coracana]